MAFLFLILLVTAGLFAALWAYWKYVARPREEKRIAELKAKAEQMARMARPFQDYVASIKPMKRTFIQIKIPFVGESSPMLANLRRFKALSFSADHCVYFVKDEAGTIYGPADEATVAGWIADDKVNRNTLIGTHEEGPWEPALKVKRFQLLFEGEVSGNLRKRFENIQIK